MLNGKNVVATIGVKDVKAARRFYGDTLALPEGPSHEKTALTFKSGSTTLLVYESQYAGTNEATAATWVVGDEIEAIVKSLKAKGVAFEHYDFPDMKREGDIHMAGSMRAAWCKDPDGNILALVTG